jgi:hypothetical protein
MIVFVHFASAIKTGLEQLHSDYQTFILETH